MSILPFVWTAVAGGVQMAAQDEWGEAVAREPEKIVYLPIESDAKAPGSGPVLTGIFLILLTAAIWVARDLLVPITVAVLLFFAVAPLRRRMWKLGIPNWGTATVVSAGFLVIAVAFGTMLTGQAGTAMSDWSSISKRLEEKYRTIRDQVEDIKDVADQIDAVAEGGEDGTTTIRATVGGSSAVMAVLGATPAVVGQVSAAILLLFFLIASADLIYLKIVQSFDTLREKRLAYAALRQIEDSLGSYFSVIFVINAGLGVVMGLAFWALGMPAPAMFGIAAFVLNFIPYLGLIIGAALSLVVALISLDGLLMPFVVAGTYLVINTIEGQVVTPMFLSRKLELNTVVVFLAVAVWGWLWSFPGMVVAVPIIVVIRVLCEHVPGWEKFGNFLSGEAPSLPAEDTTTDAT